MKKQGIRKLIISSLLVLTIGTVATVSVVNKKNNANIVKADEICDDKSDGMIGDNAYIGDDEFSDVVDSDVDERELEEEIREMEEEEDRLYEEHLNYILNLVSDETGINYTKDDLNQCIDYLNDNFYELINNNNVNSEIVYEFSNAWLNDRITRSSNWLANYNYEGAAEYADEWGLKRNPKYKDFGGVDCTNFVSQCMYEGGMLEQTDEWHPYTAAWINANGLKQLLDKESRYATEKRTNLKSNTDEYKKFYKKLKVGDVVQALDENNIAKHSMVIIKLAENGQIYLGAHSSDHNYSNPSKRMTLQQFCKYSTNRPIIRAYGMKPQK